MKQVDPWGLMRFAGWSALWVLGAACLSTAVREVTQVWFPDLPMGLASLIQLTFGVQVVLAWMSGWVSILIVFPVAVAYHWWTLPPESFDGWIVARIAMSSILVPTVLAVLRHMGLRIDPETGDGRAWARLMLAGMVAAFMIQFARYNLECCGPLTLSSTLHGVLLSMGGQVVGLWVALIALILWFRLERRVAV